MQDIFPSKNIDRNSIPIDGSIEFFKWAKSKNISMAVCTNKQEKLAVDLLKKLDISKALSYGWKPEISLKSGIKSTYNWALKNIF